MDQKPHKTEQTAIDALSQSILPMADKSFTESSTPVKKLHIHASHNMDAKFVSPTPKKTDETLNVRCKKEPDVSHNLDANFVSPTPEKTDETLNVRCKKEPLELPEKYGILSEIFDRMTTSLRLLKLHKQLSTFKNIRRQVEILTGRKFSYRNLAQIKFILPEAVQTDKIVLHNKKTLCMEPDIKITLLFDVIEGHSEHSAYIALCHTFSRRLFKFVSTHSEGCDVPEAELPYPFNQREITFSPNALSVDSSTETLQKVRESELLNPSHLHPSFTRHFSREDDKEFSKTELLSPTLTSFIENDTGTNKEAGPSSCLDPVMHDNALEVAYVDTPMKSQLVSGDITIETPDLATPKRSVATEDNKLKSLVSQKPIASNIFAKRSLDFSNADDETGAFLEEKVTSASVPFKKVEDNSYCTSKNDTFTHNGLKAHQRTSSRLSELVETIYKIFQSAHCSSITKSELVHKIMVHNFDIIESGEIEKEIELLVNKVPDWITKEVAPSGDLLYNINEGLDLKSITDKLT